MISMIIADDERLSRESMRILIDWSQIGVEVVDAAVNGIEALEKVKKQKPDILLSDIEMPDMNGVEVAKEIQAAGLKTKVIFISAYSEFVYAQSAVKYNVFDYILKPVDEQKLLESVAYCAENVHSERASHEVLQNVAQVQRSLKEQELKECLLDRKQGDEENCNLLKSLGITGETSAWFGGILVLGSVKELKSRMPNSYLYMDAQIHFVKMASEKLLLLCQFNEFQTEDKALSQLKHFAWILCQDQHVRPPIYVSRVHRGSTLARIYSECAMVTILPEFEISGKVICYEQLVSLLDKNITPIKIGELITALNEESGERLESCLKQDFLHCVKTYGIYKIQKIQLYYIRLLDELWENRFRVMIQQDWMEEMFFSMKEQIASCIMIEELYFAVKQVLTQLSKGFRAEVPRSRVVRQTVQYIQQNYRKPSLRDAADCLYVSPTYLSKLFSEEMNESFSHYTLRYRIQKAKELLQNPKYRVSDVADIIGYSDVAHFSKAFKLIEGISPGKYKNSL